ncbi:ketoacyl-synthetase C-terminal extension domain-containing protein, partial [Micromonospora echinospora]
WPVVGRPRRAAVSSFGISGTNAHVILEQPEPVPVETGPVADGLPLVPWLVSARSTDALAKQADRLADRLRRDQDQSPADVGWSLATARAALEHRAVVLGASGGDLFAGLAALAEGSSVPG